MSELFKEIKRLPISKEIMNQLRNSILNGKIKTGEKIPSERELTEQFKVSRNMVREAIRGLEMLGYLEIHQGSQGGAFVKDFTHDRLSNVFVDFYLADKLSIQDLLEARLFIEPEVARLAAKNIDTQGSLLLLETLKQESFKDDMVERLESLGAVHIALAKLCNNTIYDIMVNSLIAISQEIILNTFKNGVDAPLHGVGKHDEIVKAVLNGDSVQAKEHMFQHLMEFSEACEDLDKKYKGKHALSSEFQR